jgi:DNA-binding XRE family transcriptional regulator
VTGKDIQKLRKDKQLSQGQLAVIIGVSRQTISRAENGGPSWTTVARIKDALAQKRI